MDDKEQTSKGETRFGKGVNSRSVSNTAKGKSIAKSFVTVSTAGPSRKKSQRHLSREFVDTDSSAEEDLPLTPKKVAQPQLRDSEISLHKEVKFEEEQSNKEEEIANQVMKSPEDIHDIVRNPPNLSDSDSNSSESLSNKEEEITNQVMKSPEDIHDIVKNPPNLSVSDSNSSESPSRPRPKFKFLSL